MPRNKRKKSKKRASGSSRTKLKRNLTDLIPRIKSTMQVASVKKSKLGGKISVNNKKPGSSTIYSIESGKQKSEKMRSFHFRDDDETKMFVQLDKQFRSSVPVDGVKSDEMLLAHIDKMVKTRGMAFPERIVIDDGGSGEASNLIKQLLTTSGTFGEKTYTYQRIARDPADSASEFRIGIRSSELFPGPDMGGAVKLHESFGKIDAIFGPSNAVVINQDKDVLTEEEAKNIETFVSFPRDGSPKMSENFKDALYHLATVSETNGQFERVMNDLEGFKANDDGPFDALNMFIEYQVFKSGEHLKTEDEDNWTQKISARIIDENPDLIQKMIPNNLANREKFASKILDDLGIAKISEDYIQNFDNLKEHFSDYLKGIRRPLLPVLSSIAITDELVKAVIDQELAAIIMPEVAKNYMCECRYSEPAPTLIRRDMPAFVKDRLRAKDRNEAVHIFQTKNGYSIAYDAKKLGLNPAEKHSAGQIASKSKSVERFLGKYEEPIGLKSEPFYELVSFDSTQYMIADVQVPIMDDGVEISLNSPDGKPFTLKIGNSPEEVGVKMTDEYAGAYKRSLNSQRVIEFAEISENGTQTVFQMKGSGVPAYGFSKDQDWSGGEYLALTIEKGAMAFRDFVKEVFNIDDAVPEMVGVSMVGEPSVATNEEAAGRFGAVSFRLDTAMGIRLSNVTYESVSERMRAKTQTVVDTQWRSTMATILARNMAFANIFGLQYNDSGVTKLVDVGLQGQFADTGGLWNLDKAPLLNASALRAGISQHMSSEAANVFDTEYVKSMFDALDKIGQAAGDPEQGQIANLRRESILNDDRLNVFDALRPAYKKKQYTDELREMQQKLLANFTLAMGGSDSGPTASQRAYASGGVKAFAKVLVSNLRGAGASSMKEILGGYVAINQLDKAVEVLGIRNEAQLRLAMKLTNSDSWPQVKGSDNNTFETALESLKGKAIWDD